MDFNKYLVEFFGTMLFLFVILYVGEPMAIGVALITVIYLGGSISGGHFNPAVSVMMALKGSITKVDLLPYVLAQVLGGLTALQVYNLVK
tara:strand:- start:266 stop:535 length:270 start_codon:yes stop_codon:yes gene_type:complete